MALGADASSNSETDALNSSLTQTNPMILTELLTPLKDHFTKESRGYANQAPIPEGSRPADLTAYQHTSHEVAGIFRIAAHEVNKLIKKHGDKIITL